MIDNKPIMISTLPLPPGYRPDTRPVMMFDIENDVFDLDLGIKVYLWGCLLAEDKAPIRPNLIVAGPGVDGDRQAWLHFLGYIGRVFEQFGNIPFVHYFSHERIWLKEYY